MWSRLHQDFQEMHSLCAEPFPSALQILVDWMVGALPYGNKVPLSG